MQPRFRCVAVFVDCDDRCSISSTIIIKGLDPHTDSKVTSGKRCGNGTDVDIVVCSVQILGSNYKPGGIRVSVTGTVIAVCGRIVRISFLHMPDTGVVCRPYSSVCRV